jgi:hypothetical protein
VPVVICRSAAPVRVSVALAIAVVVAASVTLPASVPESPVGASAISFSASSRPSPKTLLSSVVPPHWLLSASIAVLSSSARVAATSPTSTGAADHSSAMAPARCGAAIDVPLMLLYPLPGQADRTFTPGAETFGLISSFCPAPRPEKSATALSMP